MLLRIQRLMKQHFEIGLVPQPFLGGLNSRPREVIFRQSDRDGWGRSGLFGPFAGNSRHSSLAQFARGPGLLEAFRDQILILRPPLGFLCLSLELQFIFRHWIRSTALIYRSKSEQVRAARPRR